MDVHILQVLITSRKNFKSGKQIYPREESYMPNMDPPKNPMGDACKWLDKKLFLSLALRVGDCL